MQKITFFTLTSFFILACGNISSLVSPSSEKITNQPVALSTSPPTLTVSSTVTFVPQPSPTITSTLEVARIWTPYTNVEQGFTISYPNFLQHTSESYKNISEDTITSDTWSQNGFAIFVQVYAEGSSAGIEFLATVKSDETIPVAGQLARKLVGLEVVNNTGTLVHIGPVNHNGKSYILIYSSGSEPASAESLAIFEQMAASFTFNTVGFAPTSTASPISTSAAALPDLAPQYGNRVTFADGTCGWGGGQITVWVDNIGQADTGSFEVNINGQDAQVNHLSAGATAEVSVAYDSGPLGGISTFADSANSISESDETNNQVGATFTPPATCTPVP